MLILRTLNQQDHRAPGTLHMGFVGDWEGQVKTNSYCLPSPNELPSECEDRHAN